MPPTEGPNFEIDQSEPMARFSEWDRLLDAHWSHWDSEARESYDFVAGRQWTEDEKAAFDDDLRIMATLNRVETTIDAVTGAEIMGRQEVTYLPRTVEDTGPTDVLSQAAQYVRQNCDAEDEESDAFRDCVICGIGWTESRPDYDDDPDGEILIRRVDPLEINVDPSSRQANFADARYMRRKIRMSREEAKSRFPDIEDFDGVDNANARQPTVVDPQVRYKNGMSDQADDEVEIKEYQWFDLEPFYRVSLSGTMREMDEESMTALKAEVPGLQFVKQRRKVYKRAFVAAGQVHDEEVIEVGDFLWKAITGKRDRNKGIYYGLVRPMKDPQRFANTAASAMINHYRETSKGGVFAEAGAVEDARDFTNSLADADKITWVKDGALASPNGPRITNKPISGMPPALPGILEMSISGVRDATGVNLELLGMADRQQPGVLEHQRKQAAYGILSAFFNAIRRYRKMQGRLLLTLMQKYLPEGTLVRIVGQDGEQKYVPFAMQDDTLKYDVIVDESPMSPNQKERVFAIMTQFQGLLADAPPEVMSEMIRYSPLPANVAEKMIAALNTPPDPQQQQAQQQQMHLQMAGAEQEVRKTASEAAKNEADVKKSDAEAARDLTDAIFNDTATQALINTGAVE